jgi:hypothetical protein
MMLRFDSNRRWVVAFAGALLLPLAILLGYIFASLFGPPYGFCGLVAILLLPAAM